MVSGNFGTAINCIDGRAQGPVADWIKVNFHVSYVDMVNMPGPDGILTAGPNSYMHLIRLNVGISVNAHNSSVIAVAGHHDCAAFGVSREQHLAAIRNAVREVVSWDYPVRVVGLWVNDTWLVEQVADSESILR